MITHEEAKHMVVFDESDDYQSKMFNYITQQEKVTKLLELYRKAHINDILNGNLNQQIKELEEELK